MSSQHVTADDIDNIRSEARYILEAKKDRTRAVELATKAHEMLPIMEGPPHEQADIYAGMAALWNDLGDYARVEPLIRKALEIEATLAERRPVFFGTRRLFYAKFLFERGRFVEAAKHAREGIATYSEGVPPDDKELAYLRQLMVPIVKAGEEEPS